MSSGQGMAVPPRGCRVLAVSIAVRGVVDRLIDSRHCDCSAYDVPRKWRGSRSSSSGRLPFHPLPASPEVRWAEEVDDDIAPLLGESYQDWRQGKRRRAICAQMNSRGGTRRRGEFVDLAPWPESEDWKGEIEEL
jgi:hypothetical protein